MWAGVTQPTMTTDAENPTYYLIKNFRSGQYVKYVGPESGLAQSPDITKEVLWYFESNGEGVNIIPAANPGLKVASTTSLTAEGTVFYLVENPHKEGYFCISTNQGLGGTSCWDSNANGGFSGGWSPSASDADGTSWNIKEVPVTKSELQDEDYLSKKCTAYKNLEGITSLSTYANTFASIKAATNESELNTALSNLPSAYVIFQNRQYNDYLKIDNTQTTVVSSPANYEEVIKLVPAGDGSFYLFGCKSRTYAGDVQTSAVVGVTADSKVPYYIQSFAGYAVARPVSYSDGSQNYLHRDGYSKIVGWGTGANATHWTITETSVPDYQTLLQLAIAEANGIVAHSGTPGYPSQSAMATLQDAVNTAQSATDYESAYEQLDAAITTALTDINYIPQTGKYYTIVNARGAMVYDPAHDESVDATNNDAKYLWYNDGELDTTDPNNLWGFVQDKDGNYYMYNAGKKQFATIGKGIVGPNGGTYGKGTWIFSNTPAYITLDDGIANDIAAPRVRVRATIATTRESYTMSVSTGYYGPVIDYDAANDGGVPMLFTEIGTADDDVVSAIEALLEDATPFRDALQEVINGTSTINIGADLGQYNADEAYTSALAAAKAAVANEQATKDEVVSALTALEDAIANLPLNMPKTGTFLRIKGKTSGKYLAAGSASNNKFNMSDATNATTIFYYDADKHLVNLASGQSNGMTASSWNWVYGAGNASTVTFGDGETNGGYNIQSASAYFYDDGDAAASSADRGGSNNGHVRYNSWELAYVNELPIALTQVGESYYATLCSPVALTISDVQAYIATAASEGKLTLAEVEGTIPANEPVILVGTSATAEFAIAEGNTEAVTGNLLSGNATGGTTEANSILTLQSHEDEAGFYVYTGTGIPAFKAYLTLAGLGEAGIKGFTFDFGTTDSIATVEGETTEGAAIYNLAGQRVEKAVKGVYIINGKKVLVK